MVNVIESQEDELELIVELDDEEQDILEKAAREMGITLEEFIIKTIDDELKRSIQERQTQSQPQQE